jgi:hypothetical protein
MITPESENFQPATPGEMGRTPLARFTRSKPQSVSHRNGVTGVSECKTLITVVRKDESGPTRLTIETGGESGLEKACIL